MRAGLLVAAMAYLFLPAAPAQNTAERDAGSKIRALEIVWNQAQEKGDVRALNMIFDSSMIYIEEDGSQETKAQFLSRIAREVGSDVQWQVNPNMRVRVYDDTAVVVGTYRVKGVRGGKPYVRAGRFIDTWAFKTGKWLCVVAQATPILQ